MKSLQLKKIKISRVGNPYSILAGAQQTEADKEKEDPVSFYCETKDEQDTLCTSQTNTARTGLTQSPINGSQNVNGGQD